MISKLILISFAVIAGFFIAARSIGDNQLAVFEIPQPTASPKLTTLLFTGDVMLGRTVNTNALDSGDPAYPFRKVHAELANADLVFINLENPIVENCPRIESGFQFCADPRLVEGLALAGIDVASIANNHTLNFGKQGFEQTKVYLNNAGIDYVGDGNLVIREVNGEKFGFLGFDRAQDTAPQLTAAEIQLIESANNQVDVLIIGFHWGIEYESIALPGVSRLARQLVDLGGDIIVGNHPHWIQNIEYYKDKPIYYALGNFVFDQMWSEETKKGMAIRLTLDGTKIVNEEKLYSYTRLRGQPEWIEN